MRAVARGKEHRNANYKIAASSPSTPRTGVIANPPRRRLLSCSSMLQLRNAKRPSSLRIVSLAPSCTSILCAIGARRHLVAVTPWCRDVAPIHGLPAFGDCWRLESIEKIARLHPTLIVGSVPFHAETVGRILKLPAQFLALNPRSIADIESDIDTLARLTNRAAAGRRLVLRMRRGFAQIRQSAPRFRRRPRIYSEAWPNPRISSPPWVSEIIDLCGGQMVVEPGTRTSDEKVASAQPDVLFLAWTATGNRSDPRKTLAHPLWQTVPAIRRKHVFVIRDELLNTPGPPIVAGAQEILKILQGLSGVFG
jgi:iron complex transport system substrate-binding protein